MGDFEPARILVVRLGSMGDVIHALPAVATLKRRFSRAHLTWAVEPRWAVLLRGNPHIDRVLPIDLRRWRKQWWRHESWNEFLGACRDLRTSRFDLAVDFQGLIKSALVATVAHPEQILGFDAALLREKGARLFYSQRVASSAAHVVDQNLDLAAAAGAVSRFMEFPLPDCPPEGELPPGDFALATPAAGWRAKQWPADYYAELAGLAHERLGWLLLINSSPADRAAAEAIVRRAPAGACALNVTSLEGLIGVTRRASAVIGVDSGPMHLAAAMGRPGVALFGPTDPARNGPCSGTFTVLRAPGAVTTYKRYASDAGSMRALEPSLVVEALERQVARHPVLEPHR